MRLRLIVLFFKTVASPVHGLNNGDLLPLHIPEISQGCDHRWEETEKISKNRNRLFW